MSTTTESRAAVSAKRGVLSHRADVVRALLEPV
jgi:hypothetical protein